MKNCLWVMVLAFVALSSIKPARADVLCMKSSLKAGKSSISTKGLLVAGSTCPKGTTQVLNTTVFTGPAGAAGSQGAQGPAGATGPQGPAGANGARGTGAYDTLPSGTTVRGVLTNNPTFPSLLLADGNFSAILPQPLTSADVIIARTSALDSACTTGGMTNFTCLSATEAAKNSAVCSGTVDNPTAPAGKLCIYWGTGSGVSAGAALEGQVAAKNYLFRPTFRVYNTGSGNSLVGTATWAYTAP